MKNFFCAAALFLVPLAPVSAVSLDSDDGELSENIIGQWRCESQVSTPLFEMQYFSEENYSLDGSGVSYDFIVMSFSSDAAEPFTSKRIKMNLTSTSQWQIKNKQIIFSDNNVTLNDSDDPELAEQLGLEDKNGQGEIGVTDFVEVSQYQMTLKMATDFGDILSYCRRKTDIV
jgi:hypothetical protein